MDLQEPVTAHLHRDARPLRADQTIEGALAELREAILPERIVYFYVEDREGRLVGVVPTRRLLAAGLGQRVDEIMVRRLVTLPGNATLREASQAFLAHRLLALPVVDESGRLIGTLDASLFSPGTVSPSGHSAIDDLFQIIGVHLAHAGRPGAWGAFRARFPWLLSNISGGILCAVLVARYERFLDVALVLALFMPVVLALAESVSIQSMTLTLQMLHAEPPGARRIARELVRELATALLLGAASGVVVGGVALAWRRDGAAALAIGLTILLGVTTASVLGLLLPSLVRAARLDPKVAAGPVTLAAADLLALLFYFRLGIAFLG